MEKRDTKIRLERSMSPFVLLSLLLLLFLACRKLALLRTLIGSR